MTTRLTYASVPKEIKKIANDSLGIGVLKSLFSHSNTYSLMVKINDGVFIGFALYHFKKYKGAKGEEIVVGVIDCVCVAEPFRKEGFGTLLTFGVLRKLSAHGVDMIELMLKTPSLKDRDGEPGVPLIGSETLLANLGFRRVQVFDDKFLNVSEKYGYDCAFCSNRPDTCKGILYVISSK